MAVYVASEDRLHQIFDAEQANYQEHCEQTQIGPLKKCPTNLLLFMTNILCITILL